jgi:hypothetical protein
MDARAPNPWTEKLEGLLDPPRERDPGELIKAVWEVAISMGHDAADDLLDAHPELFRFFPLLGRAYGQHLRNKEIAETERLRQLDWTGPKLFRDVASPPSIVTYDRVSAMFEKVDFSNCNRLVMVGCGRIPATVFHTHDRTEIPEIVALDIFPEVIDDMKQLVERLGYSRVKAELCDGGAYDYAGAEIVFIANMVSPKAKVVSRIADTAPGRVQIVVRDSFSFGRLWADHVARSVDPRLETVGMGEAGQHWSLSRDVYLRRKTAASDANGS